MLVWMWAVTGDPFTGMEAQGRYASQGAITKVFDPIAFAKSFIDVWGVHGVLHSAIDRIAFVLMMVGIAAVVRLEGRLGPWSLYSLAMVLVPAMTMSFMSFTRYPVVVFPIFIAIGAILATPRRRELRWFFVTLMLIVQFFLLIRHINASWAG